GIGAHVFIHAPAESSSAPNRLLGSAGITASRGYSAGVPAIAHFGLGEIDTVDVVVRLPGGRELSISGVSANRHIRLPGGCG
ncbi:MAG: ASPIC/UnbV domain-containing protein, partial [Acidobacteria bacterium]|nr:ASPIC/UnbV domain-containing protein [Acidobacteriota bacterium]